MQPMQRGFVVWLTGLSGAGKTTIANNLALELRACGFPIQVLDGDIVRQHLGQGLGFSRADRNTNIRRIAFVAGLLASHGVNVVVAAISPFRETRAEARQELERFLEVYVRCPIDELVKRDTKGLYARALRGEIGQFTGISDPYEEPESPDVVVETDRESVEESVEKVLAALFARRFLGRDGSGATASPSLAPAGEGRSEARPWPDAIAPHGGTLVNRTASAEEAAEWQARASHLPSLSLTPRQLSDVEMIAIGGFSPLTGFMGSRDYHTVVERMRLASGIVWPLPVTLAATAEEAATLEVGRPIALRGADGELVAVLHLEEKHAADPEREARLVYQTTDAAHPGVAALYRQGPVLLAGPITLVGRPPSPFPTYRLDPEQTRTLFAAKGWRRVVGFQTRNPVHRAHEHIQKAALETVDGLFLHPLVGETKDDDIPAAVRMRCYQALLDGYYPPDRVVLAVNPAAMRYAGPREAIFHALIRQNYGCTHFIVGRDHAGVNGPNGSYYGPFDAQRIFDTFRPGEIAITPLFFDHTYFCQRCAAIVSDKTCPHGPADRLTLSGTQVRDLLRRGEPLPGEFTRPEVAAILREAMQPAPTEVSIGAAAGVA